MKTWAAPCAGDVADSTAGLGESRSLNLNIFVTVKNSEEDCKPDFNMLKTMKRRFKLIRSDSQKSPCVFLCWPRGLMCSKSYCIM